MVALGGDLYVYGGAREMADGEETILSDILVARAENGIVNQPWKRFAVSESWLSSKCVSLNFLPTRAKGRTAWHGVK